MVVHIERFVGRTGVPVRVFTTNDCIYVGHLRSLSIHNNICSVCLDAPAGADVKGNRWIYHVTTIIELPKLSEYFLITIDATTHHFFESKDFMKDALMYDLLWGYFQLQKKELVRLIKVKKSLSFLST